MIRSALVKQKSRSKAIEEEEVTKEKGGVRIRRARTSDAKRMAELSGELGYPVSAAEMKKRIAGLRPAVMHSPLVAEVNGEVIGWTHVSVTPLLEVERRAEINGLIVADGQRSLGAGAKLLAAAEDWAKKMRCLSMSVRSNVIRDRAHGFYERNGYEHYKTQKAFRKKL